MIPARVSCPLIALAWVAGCVDGTGEGLPLPEADAVSFEESVQPVLETRCANPSCHGNVRRPLEIYAVHQHRLDPADVFLDSPLTGEEMRLNEQRCRVFLMDLDDPADCLLLRKPLSTEAGGAEHGGGNQFEDAGDGEYLALEAWVSSALAGLGETP